MTIEATIARALLDFGTAGATTQELTPLVGSSGSQVWKALKNLHDRGAIEFWPEPCGRCVNRRRWYAAGHRPQTPPPPKPAVRKATTAAEPNGVRRFVDPRFHVESAPPVINPAECRPWARIVTAPRAPAHLAEASTGQGVTA
jgi:hypothetical protein